MQVAVTTRLRTRRSYVTKLSHGGVQDVVIRAIPATNFQSALLGIFVCSAKHSGTKLPRHDRLSSSSPDRASIWFKKLAHAPAHLAQSPFQTTVWIGHGLRQIFSQMTPSHRAHSRHAQSSGRSAYDLSRSCLET